MRCWLTPRRRSRKCCVPHRDGRCGTGARSKWLVPPATCDAPCATLLSLHAPSLQPGAAEAATVSQVSGAMTNLVFHCTTSGPTSENAAVIVRVFGSGGQLFSQKVSSPMRQCGWVMPGEVLVPSARTRTGGLYVCVPGTCRRLLRPLEPGLPACPPARPRACAQFKFACKPPCALWTHFCGAPVPAGRAQHLPTGLAAGGWAPVPGGV